MQKIIITNIFVISLFVPSLKAMEEDFKQTNLFREMDRTLLIEEDKKKEVVFILGAPRSGTSATTGLLQILGLSLGDNLSDPQSWNAKGDFEDKSTIELNRKIVRVLDMLSWDKSLKEINLTDNRIEEAKNEIRTNINNNFGHLQCFGIKHPRICLLLPLYLQATVELGYVPKLIIVKRNPYEIIASLNKTSKQQGNILNEERGLAFVSAFTSSVDKYSNDYEKVTITFNELLNNTEDVVLKFRRLLPQLKALEDCRDKISKFLDNGLRHHKV